MLFERLERALIPVAHRDLRRAFAWLKVVDRRASDVDLHFPFPSHSRQICSMPSARIVLPLPPQSLQTYCGRSSCGFVEFMTRDSLNRRVASAMTFRAASTLRAFLSTRS